MSFWKVPNSLRSRMRDLVIDAALAVDGAVLILCCVVVWKTLVGD
jgi:hypothetical protein